MGEDATLLNIQQIGWIQGSRILGKQSTALWIYEEQGKDERFHIHFGDNSYVQHAHAHHIEGPKLTRRRFAVRCVKDR